VRFTAFVLETVSLVAQHHFVMIFFHLWSFPFFSLIKTIELLGVFEMGLAKTIHQMGVAKQKNISAMCRLKAEICRWNRITKFRFYGRSLPFDALFNVCATAIFKVFTYTCFLQEFGQVSVSRTLFVQLAKNFVAKGLLKI